MTSSFPGVKGMKSSFLGVRGITSLFPEVRVLSSSLSGVNWLPQPCLLGAHKWAELLRHPCIFGAWSPMAPVTWVVTLRTTNRHPYRKPHSLRTTTLRTPRNPSGKKKKKKRKSWRQERRRSKEAKASPQQRGQNQNWLPQPCLLGGQQVGGICCDTPAFSGSPQVGIK